MHLWLCCVHRIVFVCAHVGFLECVYLIQHDYIMW